uniref:Uncharacterized protein n=1 Tax=Solanum tuberosum TaxID=4113 RepID=M1DXB8_SOLTU
MKVSGVSSHVVNTKAKTVAQEEACAVGKDEEITTDDTMVQYLNIHEVDPVARQQLIDCFRSMWTVERCEDCFNNGIVNKSSGFKNRQIMPETRVEEADIKAFPNIYRIFQFHQFDWMNNAPGEYSSHLTREFYSSYAATLMNFVATRRQLNGGRKTLPVLGVHSTQFWFGLAPTLNSRKPRPRPLIFQQRNPKASNNTKASDANSNIPKRRSTFTSNVHLQIVSAWHCNCNICNNNGAVRSVHIVKKERYCVDSANSNDVRIQSEANDTTQLRLTRVEIIASSQKSHVVYRLPQRLNSLIRTGFQ